MSISDGDGHESVLDPELGQMTSGEEGIKILEIRNIAVPVPKSVKALQIKPSVSAAAATIARKANESSASNGATGVKRTLNGEGGQDAKRAKTAGGGAAAAAASASNNSKGNIYS